MFGCIGIYIFLMKTKEQAARSKDWASLDELKKHTLKYKHCKNESWVLHCVLQHVGYIGTTLPVKML